MTFIAGILHDNCCTITADNLVTYHKDIVIDGSGTTALGQMRYHNKNDEAFKILTPCKGLVAGLAGNPNESRNLFKNLADAKPNSLKDLKRILGNVMTEKDKEKFFTLIIGMYDYEKKQSHLIKWSNKEPNNIEDGEFFTTGIGENFFHEGLKQIVEDIKSTHTPKNKVGALLSFSLNQALIHSSGGHLSKIGVGGCFFSLLLDGEEIKPQEDTVILCAEVIARTSQLSVCPIKLAFRDGVFFINSPLSGKNAINMSKDKGLEAFDLGEIWDLRNAQNIEIHFRNESIRSQYQELGNRELFIKKEDHTYEPNKELWGEIEKMASQNYE